METSPIEILITLPVEESLLDTLRQVSPRLHITVAPAKTAKDIAEKLWNSAEILYTGRLLPEPGMVPSLRWIQFHLAGIEFVLNSPIIKMPDLILTTVSGSNAGPLAEYVVMMLLALGHKMPQLVENQRRAEWPSDRWERFMACELRNSTIGLVGYGSIAREVARLLQPFGAKILAAKRDAMHPEDTGYTPEGLGDPRGDLFHRLYPIEALCSMLKECDFVVNTLPYTPATRNRIGAEELAAMKSGAYLINVGRGGTIDQNALIKALQDGKLAGAALDVFAEEPLPPGNPLWKLPNVLITPHISDSTPSYDARTMQLFAENLRRYLDGKELLNRFDPQRGY
ncbi:MAG: D-2-hydroxyacid dehydrogenase [Anaerolineae bacterium]|nr:D-2-hydroxyacid dehydrogenase [Anaerolineae bacterium]